VSAGFEVLRRPTLNAALLKFGSRTAMNEIAFDSAASGSVGARKPSL
jgi:hypothetical protein